MLLASTLLACVVGLSAQSFDTLQYQAAYRNHFQRNYYGTTLTTDAKIAGLSQAWAEARFNFANFDLVPGLNWDSVYHAYLPQATAARDEVEYYRVLMRFYTHLRDGHSLIIPPRSLWSELTASLPIRTERIENKVVIVANCSTDPAYAALRVGRVIEALNGQPVAAYAAEHVAPYVSFSTPRDSVAKIHAYYLTRGSVREPITLTLRTPEGRRITETFRRPAGESMFPATEGYSYEMLDDQTALLRILTFNDPGVVAFYDNVRLGFKNLTIKKLRPPTSRYKVHSTWYLVFQIPSTRYQVRGTVRLGPNALWGYRSRPQPHVTIVFFKSRPTPKTSSSTCGAMAGATAKTASSSSAT